MPSPPFISLLVDIVCCGNVVAISLQADVELASPTDISGKLSWQPANNEANNSLPLVSPSTSTGSTSSLSSLSPSSLPLSSLPLSLQPHFTIIISLSIQCTQDFIMATDLFSRLTIPFPIPGLTNTFTFHDVVMTKLTLEYLSTYCILWKCIECLTSKSFDVFFAGYLFISYALIHIDLLTCHKMNILFPYILPPQLYDWLTNQFDIENSLQCQSYLTSLTTNTVFGRTGVEQTRTERVVSNVSDEVPNDDFNDFFSYYLKTDDDFVPEIHVPVPTISPVSIINSHLGLSVLIVPVPMQTQFGMEALGWNLYHHVEYKDPIMPAPSLKMTNEVKVSDIISVTTTNEYEAPFKHPDKMTITLINKDQRLPSPSYDSDMDAPRCFMCRQVHADPFSPSRCSETGKLVHEGILVRDWIGCYTLSNGMELPRWDGVTQGSLVETLRVDSKRFDSQKSCTMTNTVSLSYRAGYQVLNGNVFTVSSCFQNINNNTDNQLETTDQIRPSLNIASIQTDDSEPADGVELDLPPQYQLVPAPSKPPNIQYSSPSVVPRPLSTQLHISSPALLPLGISTLSRKRDALPISAKVPPSGKLLHIPRKDPDSQTSSSQARLTYLVPSWSKSFFHTTAVEISTGTYASGDEVVTSSNELKKQINDWDDLDDSTLGAICLYFLDHICQTAMKDTAEETWEHLKKTYGTPDTVGMYGIFQEAIMFEMSEHPDLFHLSAVKKRPAKGSSWQNQKKKKENSDVSSGQQSSSNSQSGNNNGKKKKKPNRCGKGGKGKHQAHEANMETPVATFAAAHIAIIPGVAKAEEILPIPPSYVYASGIDITKDINPYTSEINSLLTNMKIEEEEIDLGGLIDSYMDDYKGEASGSSNEHLVFWQINKQNSYYKPMMHAISWPSIDGPLYDSSAPISYLLESVVSP
ncbi:hypothetical protein BT96DRAFT_1001537 [Gymnopus androsaceus JB14]|uniref:Uncharacterized protein n=1 Tax=Gymnopus androsaceus JB14 TaxID=1447944 RepID=A0A6A4H1J1_9AGAR|nr:hypothetical protein BT96DRAFT_1001537 [Gymnopus androsaceus JB14]